MNEQPAVGNADRAVALVTELRLVIGQLKRRLREQVGAGDLTWSQVSVLARLDRDGPATVTTLARSEGVRPQSMGATVAALEAAGLVTGAPDPEDGRQTILSLTPVSRDLIRARRAARQDWLFRTLRAKLTVEEQGELFSALRLLKRLADP